MLKGFRSGFFPCLQSVLWTVPVSSSDAIGAPPALWRCGYTGTPVSILGVDAPLCQAEAHVFRVLGLIHVDQSRGAAPQVPDATRAGRPRGSAWWGRLWLALLLEKMLESPHPEFSSDGKKDLF